MKPSCFNEIYLVALPTSIDEDIDMSLHTKLRKRQYCMAVHL